MDIGLIGLLRSAANRVEQRLSHALAPHGVTVAEWSVLATLYRAGAIPPSAIADGIGLSRGAVTRSVDRLRAKALVVRAAGRGDARYQTIALTGAGARLMPVLAEAAAACEADLSDLIRPRSRATVIAALSAIAHQPG